ncbi:MAG: universal stress protein [Desulfatiglandales bacterium]
MLPSIKNILYATDLSKNALFAFRYAMTLANALDAKITILYVLPMVDSAMEVPIIAQMGEEMYYRLREEKSREITDNIKRKLQDFSQEELRNEQFKVEREPPILVREGDAVDEILKASDTLKIDMIVIGAHGKGILSHTFLGTVSDKLLRRSRIPVVVVPIPKGAKDIDL